MLNFKDTMVHCSNVHYIVHLTKTLWINGTLKQYDATTTKSFYIGARVAMGAGVASW